MPKIKNGDLNFTAKLWQTADKLRNNMDAAEYKHIVLGLIFLKYISDAFEEKHEILKKEIADSSKPSYIAEPKARHNILNDPDEYRADNVFYIPEKARWQYLQKNAKQPFIGKIIDDAMDILEKDNSTLKGILPKNYARPSLDKQRLGELIDLIGTIGLGDKENRSKDLLGRVYEYFLGQFADAEGKRGGQFYTPKCIVQLLVDMIEPYKGRVFDPCCGSGGMFVQSEKFVQAHGGRIGDISIYGQESNQTTWRLCKMNLAIRGIDANIAWNNEGSFLNDAHKDLKSDFILANPPFNDSDWRGDLLKNDIRWKYGVPPTGNANFAWIQHFIYHLSPTGTTGFVLANGSMASNTSGEGTIRKNIIEADLIDCMVSLPSQLFFNAMIPACLWFIRRKSAEPSPLSPLPNGEGKHYRGGFDFSGQLKIARKLRQKSTPAEHIFWEIVKNRKFLNLKFRRQHQIGKYIIDFYCDEQKLVIEIDGTIHNTPQRQKIDHKRNGYLKKLGINIIRVSNKEILNDIENTLKIIASSLPSTFGRGVGGEGKEGKVLFIDARNMGEMIDRRHRELTDKEINKISDTYHAWRGEGGKYKDIKGFCKNASFDEIKKNGYILTPGRYVGIKEIEEDDEKFEEKMKRLTSELSKQMKQGKKLDEEIKKNLTGIGYEI